MVLNEIKQMNKKQKTLKIIRLTVFCLDLLLGSSGWQDSNLRPPRPKRGAITGLRYTPKNLFIKERKAERQGFEPWQHLRVDRLAICSITTLAPLLYFLYHYERTTLKLRL